MSSINTNAGAMTALQTLKATNKSLDTTQGRISTGYRVSEAAHNAAYWSIATTMRSDNSAMSTVKDALGLGAAQVDIAYTAMDAVKDTLNQMKSKLVAAQQPDIDLEKIQEEINQLQNDLKTYAKSANFSGGNWLDVEKADKQEVVASFIRDAENNISLATITVDTSKTALFNSTAADGGLLQKVETKGAIAALDGVAVDSASAVKSVFDTDASPNHIKAALTLTGFPATTVSLKEGDSFSFDMTFDGSTRTVTVAGSAAGVDLNAASLQTAIAAQFTGFTATLTDGALKIEGPEPAAANAGGLEISISKIKSSTTHKIDIAEIKITDEDADLGVLLSAIDNALGKVTTAASDLGAIKTRIASQQDFVGKIMDAVDRGVSQLVDADMEEESTRLQALQVQQQLGIQALSIANSNTQNILSLFR